MFLSTLLKKKKKPAHVMKVTVVLNLGFFTPQTKCTELWDKTVVDWWWKSTLESVDILSRHSVSKHFALPLVHCLSFCVSELLICTRVSTGLLNLLLTSIYIWIYTIPVTNVRVFYDYYYFKALSLRGQKVWRCWCFSMPFPVCDETPFSRDCGYLRCAAWLPSVMQ